MRLCAFGVNREYKIEFHASFESSFFRCKINKYNGRKFSIILNREFLRNQNQCRSNFWIFFICWQCPSTDLHICFLFSVIIRKIWWDSSTILWTFSFPKRWMKASEHHIQQIFDTVYLKKPKTIVEKQLFYRQNVQLQRQNNYPSIVHPSCLPQTSFGCGISGMQCVGDSFRWR